MTPIDARNILSHELIGLGVEVAKSRDPCSIIIKGRIINESRNTLLVSDDRKAKRISKQDSILKLKLPNCTSVEIEGTALLSRPEDRVKRKTKRNW